MIQLVPAIDIIEGKCVRLSQGDYARQTTYGGTPADVARAFADAGVSRMHLVDLEGAKVSQPRNLRTLEAIAEAVQGRMRLEWGGGLKKEADLRSCFDAGCTDAVIGSTAAAEPETFEAWLMAYGADHMVLGADVRGGKIAVKGWQEDSALSIEDLVGRFSLKGLSQCIVTEISRDGMLSGPATELYCALKAKWPSIAWTASGGISGMKDIEALNDKGIDRVIIGKAFYEGYITLKDIEKWSQNA